MFQARGWTVLRIWECDLKRNNRAMLFDKLGKGGLEPIFFENGAP